MSNIKGTILIGKVKASAANNEVAANNGVNEAHPFRVRRMNEWFADTSGEPFASGARVGRPGARPKKRGADLFCKRGEWIKIPQGL